MASHLMYDGGKQTLHTASPVTMVSHYSSTKVECPITVVTERLSMANESVTMVSDRSIIDRAIEAEDDEEITIDTGSLTDESKDRTSPTMTEFPSMVASLNNHDVIATIEKPSKRGKRKKYQKYTPQDRVAIGKYCFEHGPAAARKAFQFRYPEMSESVTRGFRDKYKMMIGEAAVYEFEQIRRQNDLHFRNGPQPRGRPRKYHPIEDGRKEENEDVVSLVEIEKTNRSYAEDTTPQRTYRRSPDYLNTTYFEPLKYQKAEVYHSKPLSVQNAPIIHFPKHCRYERGFESYIKRPKSAGCSSEDKRPLFNSDRYEQNSEMNGNDSLRSGKRYKYQKYTPEERYNIGKLCEEIGLNATVKVYREQYPKLNESVVRTFRNRYRELLQKGNGIPVAEVIERKPSRRCSSSVPSLEQDLSRQLRQFKMAGVEMSTNLVLVLAENLIATKDPKEFMNLRKMLNNDWAYSLLRLNQLADQTETPEPCCHRCNSILVCTNC